MTFKYRHVLLLLLLLLSVWRVGYAHYYKQYNTGNGLISNEVYHIVKDSKGYLWICTNKGVVKYNGLTFEKFTTINGLTDNDIFNCYEDIFGRMWFFTFNGKYCYYKNDTIYNSNNDSFLKSLPVLSYVNTMYEDLVDSTLYIGHVQGSILKIKKNNNIERIDIKYNEGTKLRNIYKAGGKLKVITQNEWFELSYNTTINRQEKSFHDSYIYNGKIITSDEDGVKLYKDEKLIWKIDDKDVSISNIYHLYYDGKEHIHCGTRNGLIVYNILNGDKKQFFKNIRVTSSIIDIHGNYWFSSFGSGIFRLNREDLYSLNLLSNNKDIDLVTNKSGQIFLKKDNAITALVISGDEIKLKQLPVTSNTSYEPVYLTDSIFYFCPIISKTSQLTALNIFTGVQKKYNQLFLIKGFRDTNRNFILFNTIQFKILEFVNDSYRILDSFQVDNSVHTEHFVKEINSLYFFSKNIFYRYNMNDLKLQIIDTVNTLGGNNSISYRNGNIVLLVNNNQIFIYSGTDTMKRIHQFNLKNPVYSINKLDSGKYIINTDNGYEILKITERPFSITSNKIVYPFEQKDILFIHPFQKSIICKVGDELYSFPKDLLNKYVYKPRLYVKKAFLNGTKSITDIYNIHTNNKTGIKLLLSPVYFSNDELTFRYRIIDDDNETGNWYISKSDELNFVFNNSGEYSIQIQAVGGGNSYSNVETIQLTIKPSFFSSTPFYLLCAALGLFISGLVLRYNNRRRRNMFNNEMNYLQLEHKAVNSLLNPHFIFNSINNIQNLVNTGSKEQANEYLATLSIMIRQNIENLQFSLIPLQKELSLIQNYIELQNLRFNNRISYELYSDVDTDIHIPPLLIHTFIENAIVHGFDKNRDSFTIDVRTELTIDNYLLITITDDGLGINNTSENIEVQKDKISLGISFTEKRLKRLSEFYKVNHTLQIEGLSGSNTGTKVTIMIYSRFKELVDKEKMLPLIK